MRPLILKWLTSAFGGMQKESHGERIRRIKGIIYNIIPAYGEIIEKHPLVIFPASNLPIHKDDMKTALQLAWNMTSDTKLRGFIEIGYCHLAQFRNDITSEINPTLPDDATPYETERILALYLSAEKHVSIERTELKAEFDKFKRSPSIVN